MGLCRPFLPKQTCWRGSGHRKVVGMTTEMTGGGLRKQPVQERSKVTTQRILDTAARLVAERGYDAVVGSPLLLLNESGVGRGAFYAFFESPEKVLDELAYRAMRESTARVTALLREPMTHWHDVIDAMISYYTHTLAKSLIRELWIGQHLTPPVRAQDRQWVIHTAGQWLAALQQFTPRFDSLTLTPCIVATEICERLFQFAYQDDPSGDTSVIEQIRIVLVQYFSVFET